MSTPVKRSVKDILKLNSGAPVPAPVKTEYTIYDRMSQIEFDRIVAGLTTRHKPDIIQMLQDIFVHGASIAECTLKYERSKAAVAVFRGRFIADANAQNKETDHAK